MSDQPKATLPQAKAQGHEHAHPNGRRCCGRLLSEKCSPAEEAANTDSRTGEKSCCKGGHQH